MQSRLVGWAQSECYASLKMWSSCQQVYLRMGLWLAPRNTDSQLWPHVLKPFLYISLFVSLPPHLPLLRSFFFSFSWLLCFLRTNLSTSQTEYGEKIVFKSVCVCYEKALCWHHGCECPSLSLTKGLHTLQDQLHSKTCPSKFV